MGEVGADLLPYPWHMDAWQQLHEQYKAQRLPHALLIQGEKGIGKRRLANSLVQKLLCQEQGDFSCGKCKACHLFQSGTHPDFIHVSLEEKSKQIKIDQIRYVIESIGKTAQMQGNKIVVIEPSEAMNLNAANALLKSLEEPTENTYLFLVSHNAKRLLPTIKSRCQTVALYAPSPSDSDRWLATFIQDVHLRKQLLHLAANNPLLALDYNERELPSLYSHIVDQRMSYKNGQGNAISYAEQLNKHNVVDVLYLYQHILWQLIKMSMHGAPLLDKALSELETIYQKSHFKKQGFALLAEIQAAFKEAQGVTNPNTLLLFEALEIRWQALLRVPR